MAEEGKKPVANTEMLTEEDELTEYLMLRLRLEKGINVVEYQARFGKDFFEQFAQPIAAAVNAGLITNDAAGIRPTIKGFDLQNALIGEFIKII